MSTAGAAVRGAWSTLRQRSCRAGIEDGRERSRSFDLDYVNAHNLLALPGTKLCFNTSHDTTLAAIRRWIEP
ncbi:hypothetical protein WMF38_53980 [Sorangium sp. So ce118]